MLLRQGIKNVEPASSKTTLDEKELQGNLNSQHIVLHLCWKSLGSLRGPNQPKWDFPGSDVSDRQEWWVKQWSNTWTFGLLQPRSSWINRKLDRFCQHTGMETSQAQDIDRFFHLSFTCLEAQQSGHRWGEKLGYSWKTENCDLSNSPRQDAPTQGMCIMTQRYSKQHLSKHRGKLGKSPMTLAPNTPSATQCEGTKVAPNGVPAWCRWQPTETCPLKDQLSQSHSLGCKNPSFPCQSENVWPVPSRGQLKE